MCTNSASARAGSSGVLKNQIKFFFLAEVIERGNRFIPGRPHEQLVAAACAEPVSRALDLATGTGYTAGLLAEALPDAVIHGIDLSPDMLRVGRRSLARRGLHNVTLLEGDASAVPLADGTLDLVTASFALHELPTSVRWGAIAEAARLLRPGGRFAFLDIDRPARFGALADAYLRAFEPAHAREVLGDGVTSRLASFGFGDVARTAALGGLLQLVVARKRSNTHA